VNLTEEEVNLVIKHRENIVLHNKAEALQALITYMLRGVHTYEMDKEELQVYVQRAGIALHNLPLLISKNQRISGENFSEINGLDPSGSDNKWGEWCVELSRCLDMPLPPKPLPYK